MFYHFHYFNRQRGIARVKVEKNIAYPPLLKCGTSVKPFEAIGKCLMRKSVKLTKLQLGSELLPFGLVWRESVL